MSEQNTNQTRRNPYGKKLNAWQNELAEIEIFIVQLPEINLVNLPIRLLKEKLILSSSKYSQKNKILEASQKLEKIKAGIRKMTETLSQTMSDDLDNPNLETNLQQIVDLKLKVNDLLKKLADKNPEKYLESLEHKD